jgi:hypothetical protein
MSITSVLCVPLQFFSRGSFGPTILDLEGNHPIEASLSLIFSLFFFHYSLCALPSGRFNDSTTIGVAFPGIHQKFYIPQ